MGASAMNAKKKDRRRRHAKSRKTSSEALAQATQLPRLQQASSKQGAWRGIGHRTTKKRG